MCISYYLYTLRGLMQIKRYQNKKRLNRRTTIDHMWSTAKIAQMLANWHYEITGECVDMEELLKRSILSGTIKLFTGEIQGNTKSATPEIEKAIKEAECIIYEKKYKPIVPKVLEVEDIKSKVLYAKDDTLEGKILRTASLIDTTLECLEEINLSNTTYYNRILSDSLREIWEIGLDVCKWYVFDERFEKYTRRFATAEEAYRIKEKEKPELREKRYSFCKTFNEYIQRIRNLMETDRYQNIYRNKVRSVAQHEWSVALISLCIAYEERSKGNNVNVGELLQVALCHDDIEIVSGDILSNTKRVTETLEKEIAKVEEMFFDTVLANMFPVAYQEVFKERMLYPKKDTIEGRIIRVADVIDTMYEAMEEINLFNTVEFEDVYNSAIIKLRELEPTLLCLKEFNKKNIPVKTQLQLFTLKLK